jgi:hypothetical protein
MSEFNPSPASKEDWLGLDPCVDREALDRLFSVSYEELRRLASKVVTANANNEAADQSRRYPIEKGDQNKPKF